MTSRHLRSTHRALRHSPPSSIINAQRCSNLDRGKELHAARARSKIKRHKFSAPCSDLPPATNIHVLRQPKGEF